MRAVVFPKEEKGEGKGVRYGSEDMDREPTRCQEKGKHTVHEYGGCSIMPWSYDNGVLVDPDTDGVRRARCNSDRRA